MFSEALHILWTYRQGFLSGLKVTLELAVIVWVVGIIGGALLGFAAHRYRMSIGWTVRAAAFTLSSLPILVFLFWLHYPAQAAFNIVIDPFLTASFAFSMVNLFAMGELVRGALDDFPKQYITAARVCGLTPQQTAFKIQLPILLRQILPGLLMLQITMLHTTLFASLISVEEIFRVAQRINASIYKPVEIYTALGIFFIIVCLPVHTLAWWMKQKFTRDLSER